MPEHGRSGKDADVMRQAGKTPKVIKLEVAFRREATDGPWSLERVKPSGYGKLWTRVGPDLVELMRPRLPDKGPAGELLVVIRGSADDRRDKFEIFQEHIHPQLLIALKDLQDRWTREAVRQAHEVELRNLPSGWTANLHWSFTKDKKGVRKVGKAHPHISPGPNVQLPEVPDEIRQQLAQALATYLEQFATSREKMLAVAALNQSYRAVLIGTMTPVMQDLLQNNPPETPAGKKVVVKESNWVLRECGLGLREAKTGQPARVDADRNIIRIKLKKRSLEAEGSDSGKDISKLAPVEVMEAPREEPFTAQANKGRTGPGHTKG